MIPTVRNLVLGGVDIHVNEHNEKGFRVKEAGNLTFNKTRVRGILPRADFATLVPDIQAVNFGDPVTNVYV